MITVLCVKFGNGYGVEYVEKLRNMVARHLTIPYEFVCLTDDSRPVQNVRSIVQPTGRYKKMWWHKIHMFDPSLDLKPRVLYFDLDVVIHKNIDRLAEGGQQDFFGIRDFNRKFHRSWKNLNSSVMSWSHGSQSDIYERFQKNPQEAQRLHGDQDWIFKCSRDKITFWPDEWIQSYKWEIRSKDELMLINGRRNFKTVRSNVSTNPECCVAVFHGEPNPIDIRDSFVNENWR